MPPTEPRLGLSKTSPLVKYCCTVADSFGLDRLPVTVTPAVGDVGH